MEYIVDILDEWGDVCGTKSFSKFSEAERSALKVMKQDETEQLMGFQIYDDIRIVTHGYTDGTIKYVISEEITRFELMEM